MAQLVLTFVGDDRPGLVNAVSEAVAAHRGTWLESRSSRLAGSSPAWCSSAFADEELVPLESGAGEARAFRPARLDRPRRGGGGRKAGADFVTLEIVGKERPGIVRDVTQALTRLGVNIEEFASGLEGEPFTGVEMFRATRASASPTASSSTTCARRSSGWRPRSWSILRSGDAGPGRLSGAR